MPGRRLGQHFLHDPSILGKIVDAAGLSRDDTVVEIGPGPGGLTRLLAGKVRHVIAIELDEGLFRRLRSEFAGQHNVDLIQGDAVTFPFRSLDRFKVVSNIPYYVTTPILFALLDAGKNLQTMTLTIQKEVAERIVALPGGKAYGVLSIMVQYRSSPELKFVIPREAFRPVPKVDSAVVHITMLDSPRVPVRDERTFFRVVKTAFSQRRKTLANSLKGLGQNVREILTMSGIDPQRRAETLSLSEFARLADFLSAEPDTNPDRRM